MAMSDSEESAVLVESETMPELVDAVDDDAATTIPHAVQIVSILNSEGKYAFAMQSAQLQAILGQIPANMPVAVVSVVGAFRTGKSFLLSWFLRYLTAAAQASSSSSSSSNDKKWYDFESLENTGFDWRAGTERNTTGIWMWSRPFVWNDRAILLVDTQGMFDHETTLALTASIFGFSTLLSSYQIYNVDKRIQEDNLQQLALFSEYARAAVASEKKEPSDNDDEEAEGKNLKEAYKGKPFQKMEFLVRDWQHFEDDATDVEAMDKSMQAYLDKVLSERTAKDLKETREQITGCFEEITCYGLCHPGFAVTKTKFTGNVKQVEPMFLQLLDHYCKRVFHDMEPKKIHGRQLTAAELGTYIEAYAGLFQSGVKFPTASTMLAATTAANNTNAVNLAMGRYKEIMDRIAGPKCSNYLPPEELKEEHKLALAQGLEVFDAIANFGNLTSIAEAREKVFGQTEVSFDVYTSLNDARNPLAGLEVYVSIQLRGFCRDMASAHTQFLAGSSFQ